VLACIDSDAVYWFSNEACHVGKLAVTEAIRKNFELIEAEDYRIEDLVWLTVADDTAVCTYRYVWSGKIGGQSMSGSGRGTAVLIRRGDDWKILHEHLSKGPVH